MTIECVKEFIKTENILEFSAKGTPSFFNDQTCECCGDPYDGMRCEADAFSISENRMKEYIICETCAFFADELKG